MRGKEKQVKHFVIVMAAVVSAAVLFRTGYAQSASWPEKGKVITVYVPAGAGGGGAIGITEYLNKAGTDGYTLLVTICRANRPPTWIRSGRRRTKKAIVSGMKRH